MNGVNAIIVCHNHPSDECDPSEDDKNITERLVKVSKIIGIKLLDHIIITNNKFYSFFENDLIKDEDENF